MAKHKGFPGVRLVSSLVPNNEEKRIQKPRMSKKIKKNHITRTLSSLYWEQKLENKTKYK